MAGRQKLAFTKGVLLLLFLLVRTGLFSQDVRMQKVVSLYSCMKEYDIEYPKTCLAIAIYETGWLECKHCSYQFNNLFGFRSNHEYVKFNSVYDCLQYLKIWQTTYYDPWKLKHPNGNYYEFLAHMRYATGMASYVKTLKHLEGLVEEELEKMDDSLTHPSIETEGR